jgi:uncharacterized coiled-coil protein SlyX
VRQIKERLSGLEDQVTVQGAILLRLERRLPLTQDDAVMAAMQQQLIRMDRRLKELEER